LTLKLINLDKIQNENETNEMAWRRWRCVCPRTWGLRGWARCSGALQSETNLFSQELENEKRKKAVQTLLSWLKKDTN